MHLKVDILKSSYYYTIFKEHYLGWKTGLEPAKSPDSQSGESTNSSTITMLSDRQDSNLRTRASKARPYSHLWNYQIKLSGWWDSNPRTTTPLCRHWLPRPASLTKLDHTLNFKEQKNPTHFWMGSMFNSNLYLRWKFQAYLSHSASCGCCGWGWICTKFFIISTLKMFNYTLQIYALKL